jgi:predicted O-methyltransferase YrrM
MSGTVAEGRGDRNWSDEQVRTARAFNERLLDHPQLLATIVPVGDGIALAVRR